MVPSTSKSNRRKPKSNFVPKPKQEWQVKEQKKNWLELPYDVTSNILQRIGVHDILENAQKVCTTWRKISMDPAMWRIIHMDNIFTDANARPKLREMCKNAVDRSQGQLVDITIVDFANDELLEYIADRSSRLKRLEIACCYADVYGNWTGALKKLPLLEELNLYSTNLSAESLVTAGRCCPMLKTLKMNQEADRYWYGYDDDQDGLNILNEIPVAIGDNLHGLKHLELIGMNISKHELQVILDGCCHLKSLDLRQCLYLDLNGDIGKKLSEKIKCLKLPNDSLEGIPHIYVNGVPCELSTEIIDSEYYDSDYDDIMCLHAVEVENDYDDDSDGFMAHLHDDDGEFDDIEDLDLLLL